MIKLCASLLIPFRALRFAPELIPSPALLMFISLIIQFVCCLLILYLFDVLHGKNSLNHDVCGVVCRVAKAKNAINMKPENQASYVVETITMTTVTEHRIIRTAEDANVEQPPPKPPKAVTLQPPAIEGRSVYTSSQSVENMKNDMNATVIPKFNVNGTAQAITGILKGGKLRKTDTVQVRGNKPNRKLLCSNVSYLIRMTKQIQHRMKRRVQNDRFASMKTAALERKVRRRRQSPMTRVKNPKKINSRTM